MENEQPINIGDILVAKYGLNRSGAYTEINFFKVIRFTGTGRPVLKRLHAQNAGWRGMYRLVLTPGEEMDDKTFHSHMSRDGGRTVKLPGHNQTHSLFMYDPLQVYVVEGFRGDDY